MSYFVAKRIILTLAYTQQFEFPLRALELYSRLLVGFCVEKAAFVMALLWLKKQKIITYRDGYLFINTNDLEMKKQSELRKQREQFAQKKWQEVADFVQFAQKIPFITGVAVTGSLAMNNTTKDDDIDFMIVTRPHTLWITRIIVLLYASLQGKRRSFAKEEKNSWCFNLWLEESDLALPAAAHSVYTAYEVVQAQWVLSKRRVATRFRSGNSWIKQLVFTPQPNFSHLEQKVREPWAVLLFIVAVVNSVAYFLEYVYMLPHMTREKVSKTHAFFHPRDTKGAIFSGWKRVLEEKLV